MEPLAFELGTKPSDNDLVLVTQMLGHLPRGQFSVVVRDDYGRPVVLKNAPLMNDGTPMPTLYWLCGPDQVKEIGQLESTGGVDQAEADVDPEQLQAAHDRYAAERDALLPADWAGPKPSGGVGGTRVGVKCLHAHYGYLLAGGQDPVGNWIAKQLRILRRHPE